MRGRVFNTIIVDFDLYSTPVLFYKLLVKGQNISKKCIVPIQKSIFLDYVKFALKSAASYELHVQTQRKSYIGATFKMSFNLRVIERLT